MTPDPSLMDPKHYRFDLIRRKIRYELYCVQQGLLGSEDHQRPKPGSAPPKETTPPAGQEKEKRGLFTVAKAANEKQLINSIYYEVRDLIDVLENRATDTFQLDREMRKKMKNLENLIGKRAPAVAPSGASDDLPTAVSAVAPGKAAAGKAANGKAGGGKAGSAKTPAASGKSPAPPGKGAPAKPTPTKTAPVPPKAAWSRPPGVAPNNMHGAIQR